MKTLIKFHIISGICLSLFFSKSTFAIKNPSEQYLFIKDLIQVTNLIYLSLDRLKINEKQPTESNEVCLIINQMKNFHRAISDIEEAKFFLSKHKDSNNETISMPAHAMLNALDLLSKNYQDSIRYFEQLYSKESIENPNIGQMINDASKLIADRDEILKMCMQASIMATHALVREKKDKEGHLSYFTITSEELDDLKKELENYFGEKIKDGLAVGQSLSLAPASALYEFLKRNFSPADNER